MIYQTDIIGFEPVAETNRDCINAKPAIGCPVVAKGESGHRWFFIWTRNGVRKPEEIENYLFAEYSA